MVDQWRGSATTAPPAACRCGWPPSIPDDRETGLLAPELAAGITRVKGAKSVGVRVGNWLTVQQAQKLLNAPDVTTKKGLRDRAMLAILLGCGLRRSEVAALTLKHIQPT